jgi:hypothetical protein
MRLQGVPRAWPPGVVHDTVAAVVNSPAFRKSLQTTLAQRFLRWLLDGLETLMDFLRESAPARWAAMAFGLLLVLLIVGRFLLAARARDDDMGAGEGTRVGKGGDDPWRGADALLAAGRLEEAAHALYRGVVESVTRTEKLRLDPSKTSGDYARELRTRGSPRLSAFRAFARRFDFAVYGHGGCDANALRELASLAEPFRPDRAGGARAA